jgi:nitric oxide dioxygenase
LPIVLISGGIGITPLLSMLNSVVEEKGPRQVIFIHATSNSQTHPFKEHVMQLDSKANVKSYICYTSPTDEDKKAKNYDKEGYIDLDFLQSIIPTKEAQFYFCGSIPFMEAMIKALNEWNVPKENMHYEVFRPVAMLGED